MSVSFMMAGDGTLNLFLDKPYQVDTSHAKYQDIVEALDTATEDEIVKMIDMGRAVASFFGGNDNGVVVDGGVVTFNGEEVHGVVVERILLHMRKGLPHLPLVNFLNKLMRNPSYRSREQLYKFLEHQGLPLTEDGDFLAYKSVDSNFMSYHAGKKGKVDWTPGNEPEMPRSEVDDDPNSACSAGLHVGALEYVRGFYGTSGKHVVVKVNPEHVVSVPADADCTKVRCCKVKSVKEFDNGLEKYEHDLYNDDGSEWDDWDDDWDEEDIYTSWVVYTL